VLLLECSDSDGADTIQRAHERRATAFAQSAGPLNARLDDVRVVNIAQEALHARRSAHDRGRGVRPEDVPECLRSVAQMLVRDSQAVQRPRVAAAIAATTDNFLLRLEHRASRELVEASVARGLDAERQESIQQASCRVQPARAQDAAQRSS
jgi:hypothetical protein